MIKISNKTKRYLELAKKVAFCSDSPVYKHGAVLVKGGKIISVGCNKKEFNSFADRIKKRIKNYHEGPGTRHAEVAAILGVDRKHTDGATLFVVRINGKGAFRNSAPCLMCQEVCKFVGIRKIVYSIDEQSVGSCELLPTN